MIDRAAMAMAARTAHSWRRAHRPVQEEHDTVLTLCEGTLPALLRGTLYRNGPGRLEFAGVRYGHLFDGDGMVCRYHFDGERVHYRNRYVQTREFLAEARANRLLYRNLGVNLPGGVMRNAFRLAVKNTANTSVMVQAGRLYALWEGGVPHRLHPETLETLARDTFADTLIDHAWRGRLFGSELPFSAHPKRDPHTGALFNFGINNGLTPRLNLFHLDSAGDMRHLRALTLDGFYLVHDFVLTEHWFAFFLCPVRFGLWGAALGTTTFMQSVHAQTKPTRILLVPRDGGAPRWCEAPACFIFHFANAYEDERGRLVVDAVQLKAYPDLAGVDDIGDRIEAGDGASLLGQLHRYLIDPVALTAAATPMSAYACELPVVEPRLVSREHRYTWALAIPPQAINQGLAKFDATTGQAVFRDFAPHLVGEPIFVPHPSGSGQGDRGWVLSVIYNADHDRSELLVLDAASLATVARLALPHHLAPGFHGCWVEEALA
jgi:all-trans-8'-apo-beta-carotenal 15,15'-oxygenase